MQKWCLVNTTSLQLGELLCADSEMPVAEQGTGTPAPPCWLPQPVLPSALASAGTWARPHLFSPAPLGPPSICISHPLAHTSASNSSDYPVDSSALLCPWTGARGRGWQGQAGRAALLPQHAGEGSCCSTSCPRSSAGWAQPQHSLSPAPLPRPCAPWDSPKTRLQQGRGWEEGALEPLLREGMSSSRLFFFLNFEEASLRQGWQRHGTARPARKPTVNQPDASQSSSIRVKQAKAP